MPKDHFTRAASKADKGLLYKWGGNVRSPEDIFEGHRYPRGLVYWGFEELHLRDIVDSTGGPGDPPLGLVGGTTSLTEWFVFWALEQLLGPMDKGDRTYQQAVLGGRHLPGGAVVDFIVSRAVPPIGIRVQSLQFHLSGGCRKEYYGQEQKFCLSGSGLQVVDIYEQDFI